MQNFITRPRSGFAGKVPIWLMTGLATLLLCACSMASLGYRNGETLSYWWLNGYVDFDVEQTTWVKQHIGNLFALHRKNHLSVYMKNLAAAQKRLQHNVTHTEVRADYADLKKHALLLIDHALPSVAELALSLRPDQIAHIERKFSSVNDKYRKDYLRGDLEQRQRFRFKKAMEQAEYWFGDFSREQEQQIRAISDARPNNNELRFVQRARRQQVLLALLKRIQAERPSRATTITMLREYAQRTVEQSDFPEHKGFFDASSEGATHLTMAIVNITTPAQKARAVSKLQYWIDDFNALKS